MTPSPSTRDRGLSLIELVVTVALMGLAMLAVFGAMAVFFKVEDSHRAMTELDEDLRTYAESLLALPYDADCTVNYTTSVTAPAGNSASVVVGFWNGNLPATYAASCPGGVDTGIQRLTITLTRTDGFDDSLEIVKAAP
ncbi:MAG: prepilin-type N-terminal cleavage/methylation domain-containing protein [Ilumatobacteraceae bacterium]